MHTYTSQSLLRLAKYIIFNTGVCRINSVDVVSLIEIKSDDYSPSSKVDF